MSRPSLLFLASVVPGMAWATIESQSSAALPLGLSSQAELLVSSGVFVGVLMVMALYNLFIYWHSRTLPFLFYGL